MGHFQVPQGQTLAVLRNDRRNPHDRLGAIRLPNRAFSLSCPRNLQVVGAANPFPTLALREQISTVAGIDRKTGEIRLASCFKTVTRSTPDLTATTQ